MTVREIASGGRAARASQQAPTPLSAIRVGVVDGALGSRERFDRLAEIFPGTPFTLLPADWDGSRATAPEVVIVGIAAVDANAACTWLKGMPSETKVVVILHDADVVTTRKLLREGGAADVLPAPASEPALASTLERLLSTPIATGGPNRRGGQTVAFLKAGGGSGATTLAVQAAAALARQDRGTVCLADLDLQGGATSAYLDLADAVTVVDCLSAGASLSETPFATALPTHVSGLRLLAAPADIVPLEALTPSNVEALLAGLRRDAALTFLDLPAVWTAWTHQALQHSDRIVIVTRLTVPSIQMVKRQLRLLEQHLHNTPVSLVCNAVSGDYTGSLSLKAASKALGRSFDFVLPDDSRLVTAAVNQGVELSVIKRGSKLEKAIAEFAQTIAADALAPIEKRKGW